MGRSGGTGLTPLCRQPLSLPPSPPPSLPSRPWPNPRLQPVSQGPPEGSQESGWSRPHTPEANLFVRSPRQGTFSCKPPSPVRSPRRLGRTLVSGLLQLREQAWGPPQEVEPELGFMRRGPGRAAGHRQACRSLAAACWDAGLSMVVCDLPRPEGGDIADVRADKAVLGVLTWAR